MVKTQVRIPDTLFREAKRLAAAVCQAYRRNRAWALIESADVMEDVWTQAAVPGFAFRRIIDLRPRADAAAPRGEEFATSNVKDFADQGFRRVWNPLEA